MNTVAQPTSEHPQYSWNTWINTPAYLPMAIKANSLADLRETHVNKYDYTAKIAPATRTNKKDLGAEQAIIDTIKYMGHISLKNTDHNEWGKAIGQGDARRKAADRMLADGRVILLGTWSNGIALGPGKGFTPVAAITDAPAPKKTTARKPARTRKPVFRMVDSDYEEAREREIENDHWVEEGDYSPMRYADGAACAWRSAAPAPAMHGPAFVGKPRVRYIWPKMHGPFLSDLSPAYLLVINQQSAPPPMRIRKSAPTPIKTRTPYTPRVGDTVFVVVRHQNGSTTDRVVNVQRVAADGHVFRGFDRRYGRVRNFHMDHVAHIELWDGGSLYDADGKEVTLAA